MPGPSLLLAPVTLTLGPVVTWNALALLAPALSAWTAFLLCRHVTGRTVPSLAGGYVFGFSPYMLLHVSGAPSLAMVALLPVAALLCLRHVEGSLAPRAFALAMVAVLVGQFLTSIEVLAVSTLFGALALIIAYALFGELRPALRRTVALLAGAYAATAVAVSPFLYAFFFEPHSEPIQALARYPTDALAWVVPADYQALATGHTPDGVPSYASGAGYLGLPLLAVVALFAWRFRARRSARLLTLLLAAVAIASLGEELQVGGRATGVPMPWVALSDLPLLKYAIPLRFGVYLSLGAAVMLALWLAWERGPAPWALALVALAFLLPDPGNARWKTPISSPPFFQEAAYRAYLRPGDRVLAVPPWRESMRWQAQEGFPFRLAGGYLGAFPKGYADDPTFQTLLTGRLSAGYGASLKRFVREKEVTAIVVDKRYPGPWRTLFATLGVRPQDTGGVLFYRLGRANVR